MKMSCVAITLLTTVILIGCKATNTRPVDNASAMNEVVPLWLSNPEDSPGLTASECVKISDNPSIDKKRAIAGARSALAKQISVNVQAMDRSIERTSTIRTGASDIVKVERSFESVLFQLSSEALAGSKVTQSAKVVIHNVEHYCTQVSLSPEVTQQIFKKLLEKSGAVVDSKYETLLYEEFQAQKAFL